MRGVFLFLVERWWGKVLFLSFWLLLGTLCILGVLALLAITLCVQGLGFKDMPPTGHALRAEVGGGIIFVTPGEFAGQHKTLPFVKNMELGVFSFLSCMC